MVLYSRDDCGYCEKAKSLLESHKIDYIEKKLGRDFTRETLLEQFPGVTTYPVVVVNGFRIGGYVNLVEYISKENDPRQFLAEGF